MITNVLEYLESSALQYPGKVMAADEESQCTYCEFLDLAKRVGTGIAAVQRPRRPVPVFMEKSVDALVCFMGAVYAGCFYILLDPKQPSARIKQILETLEADRIIVSSKYRKEADGLAFSGSVLYYETLKETVIDEELLVQIRSQSLDTDPLYGIFTSGSTGIPKGVIVGHRSLIDFMEHFTELFHITSEDVIGNQAPFDFDVSVKDIYATIKTGATLQIIPKKYFSFPTKLLDFLEERNITTLIWAVSALCIITTLKGLEYKVPYKIRKILFSGEAMPVKHLNAWRRYLPDAVYVNLYGPTEITCNCTYYIVDREYEPGQVLPMGHAFPNERVFLLDDQDCLVTEPERLGELCVAGTALAIGYYNNEEQTEKAFTHNPLNHCYPERIYRTGDLAYYNHEGMLCFASRKDFQIKHMGHRIELGEIEAAMEAVQGMVRSCCIYDEEKNKIVACYEGNTSKKEIVKALGVKLPAFMIPNRFQQIERLPVTKNGKIDRKLLKSQYLEETS